MQRMPSTNISDAIIHDDQQLRKFVHRLVMSLPLRMKHVLIEIRVSIMLINTTKIVLANPLTARSSASTLKAIPNRDRQKYSTITIEKEISHTTTKMELGRNSGIRGCLPSPLSIPYYLSLYNNNSPPMHAQEPSLTGSSPPGKHATTFVVEHMEEYLYEWCLYEYLQMKKYLEGTGIRLQITNFGAVYAYEGQKKEENECNLKKLEEEFGANPEQFQLIKPSVVQLNDAGNLANPVCMLDMRGEQELSPGESWSTLVFGGILGDHPPRDRPAPVRQHFPQIRHLGDLQLATDTAVLVSQLILHKKIELKSIPMIREPTLKGENKQGEKTTVQMEGFSYVSQQLDINSGQMHPQMSKKDKKRVYMSEGVRRLLLQEDLAADLIM